MGGTITIGKKKSLDPKASGTTAVNDSTTVTLATIVVGAEEVLQILSYVQEDIAGLTWGEQSEESNPLNKIIVFMQKTGNANEVNIICTNNSGSNVNMRWAVINVNL